MGPMGGDGGATGTFHILEDVSLLLLLLHIPL
jgi:hypothetical protein